MFYILQNTDMFNIKYFIKLSHFGYLNINGRSFVPGLISNQSPIDYVKISPEQIRVFSKGKE